jgi:hypothetical protein
MPTTLCGLALLTSMNVLAANKIQPLNVKVGLWEVSQTVTFICCSSLQTK